MRGLPGPRLQDLTRREPLVRARYGEYAGLSDESGHPGRLRRRVEGPQAYTGVSGGVEHEKSIIAAIKDRVGGIMFWAANEAAVSSLNGKTTGENSGTLAAYAAGLVA